MEKILQHILGELSPNQVEGLDLDARYLADMGFEPIDYFGGLEAFSELKELSVAGQNIDNWNGLPNLLQLENLDLSDNELDSFEGAPHLQNLIHLDLSLNQLRFLDHLPDWPALKTLNLGHNQLISLEGLDSFAIESLTISGNKALKNLDLLAGLQQLKYCYASMLLVPDWSWVQESNLELLSFSPTSSDRVNNLGSCDSLQQLSLNLSRCQAGLHFSQLQNLTSLSLTKGKNVPIFHLPLSPLNKLSMTFCGLKSLPKISDKSVLHTLDLRFNELETLPELNSFPALKNVFLEGNPLGHEVRRQMDVRPNIQWHL